MHISDLRAVEVKENERRTLVRQLRLLAQRAGGFPPVDVRFTGDPLTPERLPTDWSEAIMTEISPALVSAMRQAGRTIEDDLTDLGVEFEPAAEFAGPRNPASDLEAFAHLMLQKIDAMAEAADDDEEAQLRDDMRALIAKARGE